MEGVFIRRNKTNLWLILLLFGLLFIVLYFVTNAAASGRAIILLLIGLLLLDVSALSALFNYGAYIHIYESTVSARYHFFGKLDCNIKDIEFVLPQTNTLTILLKSGKRYTIIGVENSWQLSDYLRFRCFVIEKESPSAIRQKLTQAKAVRWKELRWIFIGILFMFAYILIAVLLTDGRDIYEFSKTDRIIFIVMATFEILTSTFLFIAADHHGKMFLPIEQLKYRLRGAVVVSSPLPTNNIIAVYTDWDYSGRVVLCGFPNDESVYFCLQKFTEDFELKTTYTSKIYDSRDKLPSEEQLIDITPSTEHLP